MLGEEAGGEGSRPSVAVQVTSLLALQTLPLPMAEEKGGTTVVTGNAISDRHIERRGLVCKFLAEWAGLK